MTRGTFLTTAILLAFGLAGCTTTGGPTGTLAVMVADDGDPVQFELEGIWGLRNGTTSWHQVADSNATFVLNGTGGQATVGGEVPAGVYDGIRVAFGKVTRDGREAVLQQNGFDLPLSFTVSEGDATQIEISFSWPDTLFDSQQGLAFTPALKGIRIVEGGTETLSLEADEIELSGAKPPVARMRVFDETGLEVFRSDFVAESREEPVVANAGNLTFAASESEALLPGAEVATYEWLFWDGTTLEGITVDYPTPPRGGNATATLRVTDSEGGTDSQHVRIAVLPASTSTTTSFAGMASGVLGVGVGGSHAVPVDTEMAPDGSPAYLKHVFVELDATGLAHPGHDLMLALNDGAGAEIGSRDGGGSHEWVDRTYGIDDERPASGDWTILVDGFAAAAVPYGVSITLEWQLLPEDLGFLRWITTYNDGHDHQH